MAALEKLGECEQAIHWGEVSLKLRAEQFGEESQEYAASLADLSRVYGSTRNFQKQLEAEQKVLDITLKADPSKSKDEKILTSAKTLYLAMTQLGQNLEARNLIESYLALAATTWGKYTQRYAERLGLIANADFNLENYEKAAEGFKTMIDVLKAARDEDGQKYNYIKGAQKRIQACKERMKPKDAEL